MIRTQVQLTEAQLEALRELGARVEVSIAELVRRGVDQIISAPQEPSPAARRVRARAAFGRFRSGVQDLAARHDDYFAETIEDGLER